MRFSERNGYRSVRDSVQFESIDDTLRIGLWNLLTIWCWEAAVRKDFFGGQLDSLSAPVNRDLLRLCRALWISFFDKPLDTLSDDWNEVLQFLRNRFFGFEWFEVYDFLEFVANNYRAIRFEEQFPGSCNRLLEKEMAAYRLINGHIVPISEQVELDAIEEAARTQPAAIRIHLERSLELLSDRQSPDYRNSVKESISAVESLVKSTVGDKKGTLGTLLKRLDLHPSLRNAFEKLYGYTSDEGGIRHALTDEPNISFADAKFMLVACSAFVNFVSAQAADK